MSSPRRVLVLTPAVPYPVTGACQQDRFEGYRQMRALGYDVHVIAKIHPYQSADDAQKVFAAEGIGLTLVPFNRDIIGLVLKRLPRIVRTPSLIDGAALEYTEPRYEALVQRTVESYKPNVVWLEYSHLWPLLRFLKPYGIPMIMKSSLNEPRNCRDENGWSLLSILKSLPKYRGETIAARESDFIFGITPVEEEWYRSRGAQHTGTLPLRGLAKCLMRKQHASKEVLNVVFLSSNYNMGHNRDALLFLLREILPRVRKQAPDTFRFHLTGSKFPERYRSLLGKDAVTTGFVPDIGAFLGDMDIALCPWISGQGMQQKVFEPLCRSIPLITSKTAGYPFAPGKEVLLANDPETYVEHLLTLRDPAVRQAQADAAYRRAESLFSEEAVKQVVRMAIENVG